MFSIWIQWLFHWFKIWLIDWVILILNAKFIDWLIYLFKVWLISSFMFSRFIDLLTDCYTINTISFAAHEEQESAIAQTWSSHVFEWAFVGRGSAPLWVCSFSCSIAYCFLLLSEQVCSRSSLLSRTAPSITEFSIHSYTWHLPQSSIDLYQLPSEFSICALFLSLCTCSVQGFCNQKQENVQFTLKKTASSDASFMAICTSPGIL